MNWGHSDPHERGPVIATVKHGGQRNAIGAHGGDPALLLLGKSFIS